MSCSTPPPEPEGQPFWVVDAGFASQYPEVPRAISAAGGRVIAFDFPGANLESGNRYSWARDYGPLPMPCDGGPWVLWDAINGGNASDALENEALVRLSEELGAPYRALDLEVQGGNWFLLEDHRLITSTRFFEDNRDRGDRQTLEGVLSELGVEPVTAIEPLTGELTRHADMVINVNPVSGDVFVADLEEDAIALIPREEAWDQYRLIALAMRDSLERNAARLRDALGEGRVFRFPQPLPYLDPHPDDPEQFRPVFPSFVNGVFVQADSGETTYLYGLAGDPREKGYYSFDGKLLSRYEERMKAIGADRGFEVLGVQTGDLILYGGSIHCATVEVVRRVGEEC